MKSKKQYNKEYVCRVLQKLYAMKWQTKGANNNQQALANEINRRIGDERVDNKLVSKWLNGDIEPVKYLPILSEIFNEDIDIFTPSTHDDKYQYASDFADQKAKDLEEQAKKDFKIDLTFVQALKNIIPDFDSRFPVSTPLQFREFDSNKEYFKRPKHEEAAPASKKYKLLQITHDGQNQFLSMFDLKILKDVQNKVKDYVCSIFEETAADLVKREEEANRRYIEANTNIWEGVRLSADDLQHIDPYGFYTEAERKKYHIKDRKIDHNTTGGRIINEDEQEDDDHGNS